MLFIDGELVDMDDNTKITLNFKSNLFSDISKIVSSNSYTIKLPITVHNQKIFKYADIPTCGSTYPRMFHKARYFRKGVEILADALAVLISSSKSFDVALTWGNSSAFEPLMKSGKRLNELKDGGDYLVWNSSAGVGAYGTGDYLYSSAYFGVDVNASGSSVWMHPSVRAKWIIGLIESEFEIRINIPYPESSFIDRLLIVCTERKESDEVMQKNPVELEFIEPIRSLGLTKFEFKKKENQQTERYGVVETLGQISSFLPRRNMEETELYIMVLVEGDIQKPIETKLRVIQYEGNSYTYTDIIGLRYPFPNTVSYSGKIKVKTTTESKFYFEIVTPNTYVDKVNVFDVKFYMKAERNIEYNELFPIIGNLPDIKVIDFLKNITSLVGLFAIPNKDNRTISFSSIREIYENMNDAVDVTKRIIAETKDNRPRSLKYTVDGLARYNKFSYKEDETVEGDYSGAVVVNDETIDYEKEAIVMAFSATDTINLSTREVSIPIYEYNKDGAVEYREVNPRILLEESRSAKSALSFTGMDWKVLIGEYYKSYQSVVASPVIITEKIELSDIELKELDMTTPFYLGQYGRFYAIISVKAEDSGICESQLLQLEV